MNRDLPSRLLEMHHHLGSEQGKMTVLYGETTLIETSLLLAEAAKEIRRLRRQSPSTKQATRKRLPRKS